MSSDVWTLEHTFWRCDKKSLVPWHVTILVLCRKKILEQHSVNGPRKGIFTNTEQKALFKICPLETIQLSTDKYLMMTIRTHDQFNTTVYGLDDRYRGIFNERRVILMNQEDITSAGLQQYDLVDLHNYHGGVHRLAEKFIVVPYNIPRQNVATYFPEANVLVPIDSVADVSNTPTSKSVIIKLTKV